MRWLLLSLAACGYSPTAATGTGDDAPIGDDSGDAPLPETCFGTFETVCLKALPADSFTLGGGNNSFDTGQLSNCADTIAGTTVTGCVVAATSITIDGMLTATGPRPLILVATTGAITIPSGQLLDVASHRGANNPGAGANPSGLCEGATQATAAAGGAGGSFAGLGGKGGNDNGSGAGTPNPTVMPTDLRGGCGGQRGGAAPGTLGGGAGGGAVLLIARSITVDGDLNASGGGGDGGVGSSATNRGGNGGGSGGMIVFDTAALSITGNVMAQGGGGGEATDTIGPGSGDNGDDPTSIGTAAKGGSGGSGHNGGDGAVDDAGEDGENGMSTATGGGGGGGTGLILFVGSQNMASGSKIRPPPKS